MANAVNSAVSNGYEDGVGGNSSVRPPRLPRWTRQEILVLIQGKKVVESRRRSRTGSKAPFVGSPANPVEPKWASVSSYCRRHGVNRGPVQCRKRWSNLAGDYKKIKEWQGREGPKEEFWVMRNDLRRERKLPGFFDREVYDILDGAAETAVETAVEEVAEEEEAVFDSGRAAGDDGLFSDFEQEPEEEEEEKEEKEAEEEEERPAMAAAAAVAVTPISEKKYQPFQQECSDQGMTNEKQPADNPEKGSSSREGQKRRRTSQEGPGAGDTNLQNQLIEVLERNSRMLTAQLEVQNVNCQLDRDQRKDHADSLLGVLSKLANALGKIADKL